MQGEREQLREEQQRVTELQIQLETNEQLMTTTREQMNEYQGQEELLTEERQRVTELQSQLERKEQEMTTTREQLTDDNQRQGELLREEQQQRAAELQSQLKNNEQEMTKLREQLNEYQRQVERLRERQGVTKLQNLLRANERKRITMREQLSEFQKQEEQLREERERVTKLLSLLRTNEQKRIAMSEQMNEFLGERERLGEEQERVNELQSQLETKQQEMTTMREQLEGRLREGQQHVTGLQSQLQANQQEMTTLETMLEQMNDLFEHEVVVFKREQQQQVTELQSQLETKEREIGVMRLEQRDYVFEHRVVLRGQQQRVTELQCQLDTNEQELYEHEQLLRKERRRVAVLQSQLETNQQELTTMREQSVRETQLNRTPSRDWVINRDEIEIMTDQKLGEGAWGIVYRGKFHGCDVAVKEMHANIMSDRNRHLFEREVDMASRCRHPCLLQFIGATIDERTVLVTEIMERSLREGLYNGNHLSQQQITVISLDVAKALNYLHQKRPDPIIHNDVSSANVLLWRQGNQWRAKVSDYGTANFVRQSNINYAGAVIYCAPEFLNEDPHQPISCKVDVYSFGVLLCEMCIREQPNPQERQRQIARMEIQKFQNLVGHCVAREPWDRLNMESVIKELERLEVQEGAATRNHRTGAARFHFMQLE